LFPTYPNAIWAVVISKSSFVMFAWRSLLYSSVRSLMSCFALSVAARNVVAVYRPLLEPMGLTHPQYLVMLALWQHEPVSVRKLSQLLQLDPGK